MALLSGRLHHRQISSPPGSILCLYVHYLACGHTHFCYSVVVYILILVLVFPLVRLAACINITVYASIYIHYHYTTFSLDDGGPGGGALHIERLFLMDYYNGLFSYA